MDENYARKRVVEMGNAAVRPRVASKGAFHARESVVDGRETSGCGLGTAVVFWCRAEATVDGAVGYGLCPWWLNRRRSEPRV
jgi:hypothetical protein